MTVLTPAQQILAEHAAQKRSARRPKFGNQPTEYGGVTFASKAEARCAERLDWQQRAGQIRGWQHQVGFRVEPEGCEPITYIVDFVVEQLGGSQEAIEVKSKPTLTPDARLKHKLFRAKYPTIPLRIQNAAGETLR